MPRMKELERAFLLKKHDELMSIEDETNEF